jgi:hypothetical protein
LGHFFRALLGITWGKSRLFNLRIQKGEGAPKNYNKMIALETDHLQARLNLANVYEKMKKGGGL